jgi:hypothetical protein
MQLETIEMTKALLANLVKDKSRRSAERHPVHERRIALK